MRPTASTVRCYLAVIACFVSADATRAQDITFDNLKGSTVVATVVYAQTFRRLDNDRIVNNTNTQTIRLTISPDGEIDQVHSVSITAPNGRHVGDNSFNAKFALNKPRKGLFGEMIWLFDEGKLVRLQTFESGGRRVTLTFKRAAGGLGCAVEAPFAREGDNETVKSKAAVGGDFKIQWISVKQSSSNCRVEKGPGS